MPRRPSLLCFLALLACEPGAEPVTGARLAIDPPALGLGDVVIGEVTRVGVQIRNAGDTDVTISGVQLLAPDGTPVPAAADAVLRTMTTSDPLPAKLTPGRALFVSLEIALQERKTWAGTVSITSDAAGDIDHRLPLTACGRIHVADTGTCAAPPEISLPPFAKDPRLQTYFDFVKWPGWDFAARKLTPWVARRAVTGRGLDLSALPGDRPPLTYAAGNGVLVRLRREFLPDREAGGMVFATTARQSDDGLAILGNRIGARTWNNDYRLLGTALTDLLPERGVPASFGLALEGKGATFWAAGRRFDPVNLGPGRNYDSLIVEGLWLGANQSGEDAWADGPLVVERLAIFSTPLSDADFAKFVPELGAP